MRFHKMINIFFLIGTLLLHVPSANAAAVDYLRRPEEPRYGPRDYNLQRQPEKPATQPVYDREEENRLREEILIDLLGEIRNIQWQDGFDISLTVFKDIIDDKMRHIPPSPYQRGLVRVLNEIKGAVETEAKKTPFLVSKMIFDTLSESEKEAFAKGLRVQKGSFEQLKRMPQQKKEKLQYNEELLKVLLIQLLDEKESRCSQRSQCLTQSQNLLNDFSAALPASLSLTQTIEVYSQSINDLFQQQNLRPIVLAEMKKRLGPTIWKAIIKKDSALEEESVSDREVWGLIKGNLLKNQQAIKPVLPWEDLEEQERMKKEQEVRAEKIAKQQKEKEEKDKGFVEKQTDVLKEKATAQVQEQGAKIANNLLGSVLGSVTGQANSGAGAAANAFKGLLGG